MSGAVELMILSYHVLMVVTFVLGLVLIWNKTRPNASGSPFFKLIGDWSITCERPYDTWFVRVVGFIVLIPVTPVVAFVANCLVTGLFAIVWFIYTNAYLVFGDIAEWAGFP